MLRFLLAATCVSAIISCVHSQHPGGAAAASLEGFATGAPSSATTAIVECDTTVGRMTIDVKGHWSPRGARRFLEMVDGNWFENLYMPRVVKHYLTQFGPRLREQSAKWPSPLLHSGILDDPPLTPWLGKNQNISLGTMFFAGSGTNSRGTDMCIAFCPLGHCASLGTEKWETPFARIRELENVRKIDRRVCTPICKGQPCLPTQSPDEGKNCDMPPFGIGPGPGTVSRGEAYLNEHYPLLQKFLSCQVTWRATEHEHAFLQQQQQQQQRP